MRRLWTTLLMAFPIACFAATPYQEMLNPYTGTYDFVGSAYNYTNLLPNTNWQIWSALSFISAQDYQGNAGQNTISITGFTVNSTSPTLYASNTQQLYNGALFYIAGTPWGNTAMRVSNLVPNTSFTIQIPMGYQTGSVSGSTVAVPITPGDGGMGNGNAADGWGKAGTLIVWPDDFPINQCPGAIRVLAMRKGSSSSESVYWADPHPAIDIQKYAGRTITFGALVWQKYQQGSGTYQLYIQDSVGTSYSTAGTGSSYSDPADIRGGYQFVSVTRTIPITATTLYMGLQTQGASGDIYYMAIPTAVFAPSLAVDQLGQNPNELLYFYTKVNAPEFDPLTQVFPSTEITSGYPAYGYPNNDMEALTFGQIHWSVKSILTKVEFTAPAAGFEYQFWQNSGQLYGLFGPEDVTAVSNVGVATTAWLPLDMNGQFQLTVSSQGGTVSNMTLDMIAAQF